MFNWKIHWVVSSAKQSLLADYRGIKQKENPTKQVEICSRDMNLGIKIIC